jgi:hypothetical protein
MWWSRPILTLSTANWLVLNTLQRLYIFTHKSHKSFRNFKPNHAMRIRHHTTLPRCDCVGTLRGLYKDGLIGNMPLQLLSFWDMPLQFMKLDICHCSSTRCRNWMANFQYCSELQWQVSNITPNCNGKFRCVVELQWQVSVCGWIAMANFQLDDF